MDFSSALSGKHFFRFTGPPEHWLTAIKHMTWGLEQKHEASWKKIQTGDVFFIHSTGAQASAFSNATSGIVGIGVVGFDFSIKNSPLWYSEIKEGANKWPLLVPLTEVYLFSELPDPATWENPEPKNDTKTAILIDQLLKNRVPISEIKGFPQMGSFSSVSFEVAKQILFKEKNLYLYSGHSKRGVISNEMKPSDLSEVHDATETLRSAASLRFLGSINQRIIEKPYSLITRHNDILARAEESHYTVLQSLIEIFRKKGYATLSNKHVDLFAHDGKRSFLFEVKSTENKNFRVQARKGIVQLHEYDYFEIEKFKKESELNFDDQYKILVPSQEPKDEKYIDFINFLDLGIAMPAQDGLKVIGKDLGFSKI
jgi:hypothetical protein